MTPIQCAPAGKNVRIRRAAALALLLGLCFFPARAVRADARVRVLFDDINDSYDPAVRQPNPPTDGCRPAVDDSDDNGCVTEAAGSVDDDGEGG